MAKIQRVAGTLVIALLISTSVGAEESRRRDPAVAPIPTTTPKHAFMSDIMNAEGKAEPAMLEFKRIDSAEQGHIQGQMEIRRLNKSPETVTFHIETLSNGKETLSFVEKKSGNIYSWNLDEVRKRIGKHNEITQKIREIMSQSRILPKFRAQTIEMLNEYISPPSPPVGFQRTIQPASPSGHFRQLKMLPTLRDSEFAEIRRFLNQKTRTGEQRPAVFERILNEMSPEEREVTERMLQRIESDRYQSNKPRVDTRKTAPPPAVTKSGDGQ